MRIIFMGTPEFALPALEALWQRHTVVMVVTQPDAPSGRGQKVTYSPVKQKALELGVKQIYQPSSLKTPEAQRAILQTPADYLVTAAYGQILPPSLLTAPNIVPLNIHASLLPKYRGPAPIQRALMAGDEVTGVSLMRMDEGIDTGAVLHSAHVPIPLETTYGQIHDRLAHLGAKLLLELLTAFKEGTVREWVQDSSQATYAPSLQKEEQLLDWNLSGWELHNRIRAMNPAPGAESYVQGNLIKIWQSYPWEATSDLPPGTILPQNKAYPVVVAGSRGVILREVQPAGKRRMDARDWLRGMANTGNPLKLKFSQG
ncbi:MAG: methionyl-tRNA formyltransferase [Symbiobacteriaceae bacterium]|nr:methionyl-tRNA formyltransferase [Symbiobacteriaceae bacterium]